MNKFAIVWCVNDSIKYNMLLINSIFSIIQFNLKIPLIVLTIQKNPFIDYIRQFNGVDVYSIDIDFDELKKHIHYEFDIDRALHIFTYSKILLLNPNKFKKYDFLLYLDCDTICKRPLYDSIKEYLNNKQFSIGIVKDVILDNTNKINNYITRKSLPYQIVSHCGNAGVLLISKKAISLQDYNNILLMLNYNIPCQDEGVLNVYFRDNRIIYLNPVLNTFDQYYGKINDNDIVIKHFSYQAKEMFFKPHKNDSIIKGILNHLVNHQ